MWRVSSRTPIHRPIPGIAAATTGESTVDAADLLAALIDDVEVVGCGGAVGPMGAAVFEHHAASIAIAQDGDQGGPLAWLGCLLSRRPIQRLLGLTVPPLLPTIADAVIE